MNCWNCGTANQPDARFCIQCGAPQARACPVCAHTNPPAARFCSNCGSPLPDAASAAAAQLPSAGTPVAERRLVSVLFVDLVGSTNLAEDRDPEETRELLSRYFELARRTVEGHGGTIEKFIGDAVMAVWGAPTAHEDDAERAVRAALELVSGVSQLQDGGVALQARAGVLTGEVAVTIGAQGEGMVAGDLVNTASRMQGAAEPGTVLVGEATMRAASNAVSFEPAGEHLFKGKSVPVAAWRAVAVVARRGGEGRASALEPPFVGRDDELQQLKDLFEATGRERKPRLVTVMGQAGIGKSRLVWEFEKYLDGVVETAYWHEGRSPAYGQGISYWALSEMVRRRAGISDGDEPAEARSRLAAMLDEFVSDAAERRWIEPRLAGLLGLSDLPSEGREELFSAWRTLFERIAAQAPVIMVFTDLQWADAGLLDFVEDLLNWARSSPIMVIALARPELLERRADWGSTVRSVTRINLEPLNDGQMRRLLSGLLPGLPEHALDSIVARAEGIPLYAVETVRMLLDTGAVVERDGHYAPQGDLEQLAVAETLHALIAARLDANRPEDRALLQDASVLGQSFTVGALAAVSGTPSEALAAQLDRLVRRQLLVRDQDPRSPERGQYRFIQSLVREVTYQSLAREERRSRHLAAARYFETLDEDELTGVLANHYLAAFQASRPGPEADALAAQARVSLQAAAERASALHSYRQAIAYLELALTVTHDLAEQAALHERIARAGDPSGEHALAIQHATRARELYRQVDDQLGALRAGTWLGRNQIFSQAEDEAVVSLDQAIAAAEPLGDVPELGEAYAELARAHMLGERHPQAVVAADRALGIPRATPWAVIEALITKGTSLGVLGREIESEASLRGAIHLAGRYGLIAAGLRARNNLWEPLSYVSMAEAVPLNQEGYEMSTRLGHRPFRYQFLFNLLEIAWRTGDWDAWTAERDDVVANEHPSPFYRAGYLASRSLRLAAVGDMGAAENALDEEIRVTEHLRTSQLEAAPHVTRAWLRLLDGRWREAAEEGALAAVNSNFTVQGWYVAALAAGVGGLDEVLDQAIEVFTRPAFTSPVVGALARVASASAASRAGNAEVATRDFAAARTVLLDNDDRLYGHLAGLLWNLQLPGRAEADEAGAAAEAFFAERGAAGVVERFRAGFAAPTPPSATAEHGGVRTAPR